MTEAAPATSHEQSGDNTRPVARPRDGEGSGFRPDVQGLRALAVTMVVVYHLYPSLVPGGFAGVDVFFVISGFLITGHLWREYRKAGRCHWRRSGVAGPGG